MHVRNEQEEVRRLTAENAALRLQLQQQGERLQRDARKEVPCDYRLFITSVNLCPLSTRAASEAVSLFL